MRTFRKVWKGIIVEPQEGRIRPSAISDWCGCCCTWKGWGC